MTTKALAYKPAHTILADRSVKDALKKMVQEDCNSICVLSETGDLLGIISIQDIAGATVPAEFQENVNISEALHKEGFFEEMCRSLEDKPVTELMRSTYMAVSPETNIMTITADFLHNDLYNVPVMKDDKLVGVITRSDIRNALLEAMK